MKKVFMMIAMMAVTFAAQAQTKFHDVEANDAQGPVKSITTNVMGQVPRRLDILLPFLSSTRPLEITRLKAGVPLIMVWMAWRV